MFGFSSQLPPRSLHAAAAVPGRKRTVGQVPAATSGVGRGIDHDATAIGVDPHGPVAVDGGGGGERGGCDGGGR